MDFFLGLIAGYFLNWIALSALVLLAIFLEALECTTTALLVTAFTAFVAYLFFQVPLSHVLYGSAAYALVGVVWSVWRYRRYVRDQVEADPDRLSFSHIAPANQAGRIVHWMVVWPISMASNLIGDLLVLAKTIVTDWLRDIYEGIYRDATVKKPQP